MNAVVAEVIDIAPADDLAVLPQRINAAVQAAETHARSAVECAMRAGALLTQAKALVKHGEWETWLQKHVTCAPRTAQAYMRLHAKVLTLPAPEAQRVAGLPLREAIKAIATTPEAKHKPKPPYRAPVVRMRESKAPPREKQATAGEDEDFCSFCGRGNSAVDVLIVGLHVEREGRKWRPGICNFCLDVASDQLYRLRENDKGAA